MSESAMIPAVEATEVWAPPDWALLERTLFAAVDRAAELFVARYSRADGTLIWRDRWAGMDGADDPYEAFYTLPLLYAAGGGRRLLELARRQWDAVTWQWEQYGQIHDEFFAYYDWMHHGESIRYLYALALADPGSLKDRQRAVRFAALYAGENSANYDAARRLMRSPLTGSLGARTRVTAEDWSTHRWIMDMYPPPFEDLPVGKPPDRPPTGAVSPGSALSAGAPRSAWTDDTVFAAILERFNARMVRGDVPLNLTATSLATHAYMCTGFERYRRFVLDYLEAWKERTARNGGIVPDNVGLSGEIGEYMEGKWWGGYYGYRWPHGIMTILEPLLIAGANAVLLTGDRAHLDLIRSQLDRLHALGHEENGRRLVPQRHVDAGWTDYAPQDPAYALWCWNLSLAAEDRARIARDLPAGAGPVAEIPLSEGLYHHTPQWFEFLLGQRPGYPDELLRANYRTLRRKLAEADELDPEAMDVHHWQDRSPLRCEALTQLTMGAPLGVYHGGLFHAAVRYYDAQERRPGLPNAVGALVESLAEDAVTLALVNLDPVAPRTMIVQAGAYGEHRFEDATVLDRGAREMGPGSAVGGRWLCVNLGPAAGIRLRLRTSRFANRPSYATPWLSLAEFPPLIHPRARTESGRRPTGTDGDKSGA